MVREDQYTTIKLISAAWCNYNKNRLWRNRSQVAQSHDSSGFNTHLFSFVSFLLCSSEEHKCAVISFHQYYSRISRKSSFTCVALENGFIFHVVKFSGRIHTDSTLDKMLRLNMERIKY